MLFGEAASLPCVLEEQVLIAHLLAAYDRWLVCPLVPCQHPHSSADSKAFCNQCASGYVGCLPHRITMVCLASRPAVQGSLCMASHLLKITTGCLY